MHKKKIVTSSKRNNFFAGDQGNPIVIQKRKFQGNYFRTWFEDLCLVGFLIENNNECFEDDGKILAMNLPFFQNEELDVKRENDIDDREKKWKLSGNTLTQIS